MTERESETILAFKPPPLAMLRLWLAPARAWHQPSFLGVERVDPSRPILFVGNHTLYGVQDVPHIQYELAAPSISASPNSREDRAVGPDRKLAKTLRSKRPAQRLHSRPEP